MCKMEIFERELKLRFSTQTVKSYTRQFKLFSDHFKDEDLRYLSEDSLKDYILLLHDIYGYSAIIHAISAIKFYYSVITKRKRKVDLPLPVKPKTLPTVLNIREVQRMINATLNIKHRAIIEIMFCHGLRRSELINLRIKDIDSENMELIIKQSKGLKDRNIPLNEDCLKTLRLYYRAFSPKIYLFNGQNSPQYSVTSLTKIIKRSAKIAGIKKNVHPHTLRHSFASYLVSIDTNLTKIREWMGHSSTKTTEIYCHVNNGVNPIRIAL